MHRQFAVVIAALGVLQGCASVDVVRVTSRDQPGIRYWRPAPYNALAPSTDGKSACEAKLVVLPDKSEEYAITMNAGIGTAEASPQLQDGWNLTGLTEKADSKTAENIGALASLISSVANIIPKTALLAEGKPGAASTATKKLVPKCTGLFRLKYNEHGVLDGFEDMHLPENYYLQTTMVSDGSDHKPDNKPAHH